MEAADLERVVRIAKKFLPPGVDYENIAMDVLIESWQNGVEQPSRSYIKNRCWDALRRLRTELRANEGLTLRGKKDDQSTIKGVDFDNLMTKMVCELSVDERKVIWYRFYLGIGVAEIAEKMECGKGKIYIMLTESLFKMRQEISNGLSET